MTPADCIGLTLEAALAHLQGCDVEVMEASPSHQREPLGQWRVLRATTDADNPLKVFLVVAREQLPIQSHAVS